ncbi:hypothetical protein PB1_03160 [Bacillus methanolicus PB1]|uniref:DUF418 domain-containing protein n=1 Tax=Bacillus methanolicus PB1 TaxID=997296 RepID=I3E5Y4_BACMT|nr:DUF418 domain-containing protein [Bacillus methanolicus]EIJ81905.1 hypothetical protein PB1_03160 [Bacillus methanolicus PB1]
MPDVNDVNLNQERILSLDIMRGFAILGIFLVNMLFFHSPILYIDPMKWWNDSFSKAVYTFIDIFAQASFYPLFSMLFGYGLVILMDRSQQKKVNFYKIAARRLFLLLLIGMIHAFFIWHGDILMNYAVIGFIFLLFLQLSGRSLTITGMLLYVIPNIFLTFILTIGIQIAPEEEWYPYDDQAAAASIEVYSHGSFTEITEQRIRDWYEANNLESFLISLTDILPLFMLGAGAAKLKLLENPKRHKKRLLFIMLSAGITGIMLKIFPYLFGRNIAIDYFQDIFGGPLLSIAYALIIAFLANRKRTALFLSLLAAVGKMSLSNYLFQSLVSTFIFYSYGLGYYGKASLMEGTILALAIFVVQTAASFIWMKHFYYGPMEWLWRSFTYLSLPKWKRFSQ